MTTNTHLVIYSRECALRQLSASFFGWGTGVLMGMEPRGPHQLDKHSVTELYP